VHRGRRVIVIGAGISGLSTAFWLHQSGVEVTVVESSGRTGGVIRSEQLQGYTVDQAAHCLMNYLPEVNYLCETVGLSSEQLFRQAGAEKRYMVKNGQLAAVPDKVLDIAKSSYWSPSAKLRMMLEPLVPKADPAAQESVADFIRRRFGNELYDRAIEPFVAGTLAGDAQRVCAKSVLPKFSELESRYGSILKGALIKKFRGLHETYPRHLFSFKAGMEALPSAIADYLGAAVHTDTQVQSIHRQGACWSVQTVSRGSTEIFEADAVVLATPAPAAAKLLQPLSNILASQLQGMVYAPMVVLTLGFNKSDIAHPLDGIGCLIPGIERKHLLGQLWSSSLFAGRAPMNKVLMTCYLGGMTNPQILQCNDQWLSSLAMQELKSLLGVRKEPEFVHVVRHTKGLPQYHLGHQQRLQSISTQLRLLPGLHLTGNYLHGVSVRDCITRGKKVALEAVQGLTVATDLRHIGETTGVRKSAVGVSTY